MISSLRANSNFKMFPKTHKCFNMILHVFSFILEIAFYKIKCTSINGISTRHSLTVEHLYRQHWALSCISKNEPAGSLKFQSYSGSLQLQSRKEQLAHMKDGQGAGGSTGFSLLRAPYPPGKPEAPKKVTCSFPAILEQTAFSKQLPKSFGHSSESPGWRWTSTVRWGLQARLPWQPWFWLQGVVESNVFAEYFC